MYRFFDDLEGFKKEASKDVKQGLVSKTIIHPSQIDLIDEVYRVTKLELEESKRILNSSTAITSSHGSMLEKKTQSRWAENILKRAEVYGVI